MMNYDQASADTSFAIKLSVSNLVMTMVWMLVFINDWVAYTPAGVLLLPFFAGVFLAMIGVPSSVVGLALRHPQTRWWWLLCLVSSGIGLAIQLRAITRYLLPGC